MLQSLFFFIVRKLLCMKKFPLAFFCKMLYQSPVLSLFFFLEKTTLTPSSSPCKLLCQPPSLQAFIPDHHKLPYRIIILFAFYFLFHPLPVLFAFLCIGGGKHELTFVCIFSFVILLKTCPG